jgi:hypothetical protein
MDRGVSEVEEVTRGNAGALELVDGDGGGTDGRVAPDDDEGHVAIELGDGFDDTANGGDDDDALHVGRPLPFLSSVTKLKAWPASRAAASMPNSVWEGPNCAVSTAITPKVRELPPASTRAAVLA